jgi:5-methylcytosine-specific restriction enzyme subunit McrC
MPAEIYADSLGEERRIGRIPVRNLWLLMLYASDLTRVRDVFDALVDDDLDNLPDLVARLLADTVEHRRRRNLTRGYRHRAMVLTRVRGRIDVLTTEARQLISRGEVFCRFEEQTTDTPRNRLIRAALDLMARFVRDKDLSHRCRSLAADLARSGVGGVRPSRADMAADQIGRNDAADRFMVALARLAFDLALPTEDAGATPLVSPDREEAWARRLFEKAVLGFARVELVPLGWSVRGGIPLEWQISSASEGLPKILPRMVTDIVLDPPNAGRRVVIDTKFTSILASGRFRDVSLKSGYLYQMYAYLRSQEGCDPRWDHAAGLLLHPAIDASLYERVVIQNHPISFATVDLGCRATVIRNELRNLLREGESKRRTTENSDRPSFRIKREYGRRSPRLDNRDSLKPRRTAETGTMIDRISRAFAAADNGDFEADKARYGRLAAASLKPLTRLREAMVDAAYQAVSFDGCRAVNRRSDFKKAKAMITFARRECKR